MAGRSNYRLCDLRIGDMSQYPSCFPEKFETEILPKEIRSEEKLVYRVIKKGYIDRDGFIGTFEEIKRGMIPPGSKLKNLNDPSLYSTSCNEQISESKYVLKLLSGHHPAAIIARGKIMPSCGPWQLTFDRTGKLVKNMETHIDWWIYDESSPQEYFQEVDCDEK